MKLHDGFVGIFVGGAFLDHFLILTVLPRCFFFAVFPSLCQDEYIFVSLEGSMQPVTFMDHVHPLLGSGGISLRPAEGWGRDSGAAQHPGPQPCQEVDSWISVMALPGPTDWIWLLMRRGGSEIF